MKLNVEMRKGGLLTVGKAHSFNTRLQGEPYCRFLEQRQVSETFKKTSEKGRNQTELSGFNAPRPSL